MSSMKRSARRLGLAALILIGLGAVAQAEPIKPQDIEDNRQTCMSACIEKTGDQPHCTAACDCSVKGLAEQVTQEEYDAAKAALASQQQPSQATVDKLHTIAKSCAPLMKN